jgi:hypothetical protein
VGNAFLHFIPARSILPHPRSTFLRFVPAGSDAARDGGTESNRPFLRSREVEHGHPPAGAAWTGAQGTIEVVQRRRSQHTGEAGGSGDRRRRLGWWDVEGGKVLGASGVSVGAMTRTGHVPGPATMRLRHWRCTARNREGARFCWTRVRSQTMEEKSWCCADFYRGSRQNEEAD